MSNLLKFHAVVCDEHTKMIDYNDLIEERLKERVQQKQNQEEEPEDGFVAGLEIKEIDVVEEEQEADAEELLKQSREEADRLVEEARRQAEELMAQALEEGRRQGYEEGMAKAQAECDKRITELNQKEAQLQQKYQNQIKEMEPNLVEKILEVVEHVVSVEVKDKQDMVIHLLEGTLNHINSSNQFMIRVAKEDYGLVKDNKSLLEEQVIKNSNIEIVEDLCLGKNQCMIETDGGIFDCSLDVQLENLKKAILILARQN